jgi:molybdate transport system substrate-binding protein
MRFRLPILCTCVAFLAALPAGAAEVSVAVATNFAEPLHALARAFATASGHTLRVSAGSSGKLYAQIVNGAPFEVFLSADQERTARLETAQQAVPGTRFTYAFGRLALWSPGDGALASDAVAVLKAGAFRHVALANPDLAPYGLAARQTLERLGLWTALAPKVVMGQDAGQTFNLVATGNAELGFVALSQLRGQAKSAGGSFWVVPADLHAPVRQDAVLLRDSPAARAFLAFLRSPEALRIIEGFGYGVEAK